MIELEHRWWIWSPNSLRKYSWRFQKAKISMLNHLFILMIMTSTEWLSDDTHHSQWVAQVYALSPCIYISVFLFDDEESCDLKTSWDFSKKSESDDILKVWKMTFQASDLKGNQFLDLLDDNNNFIEPAYVKGGLWLKTFSYSNSLCVYATRAITNHAPIGEYRLRFFPRKEFKCPCSLYPIESRCHILHECGIFNGYWNLRRDSLSHFVMFLVTNLSAFTFSDSLVLSGVCCGNH